jgi:hypothetical protein
MADTFEKFKELIQVGTPLIGKGESFTTDVYNPGRFTIDGLYIPSAKGQPYTVVKKTINDDSTRVVFDIVHNTNLGKEIPSVVWKEDNYTAFFDFFRIAPPPEEPKVRAPPAEPKPIIPEEYDTFEKFKSSIEKDTQLKWKGV